MDGAAGGGAAPVVHEGSWWLLGLGLLAFALLVVVLAGALTRLYLDDEIGEHRAARATRATRATRDPGAARRSTGSSRPVRPRPAAAHRLGRGGRWRRPAPGAA